MTNFTYYLMYNLNNYYYYCFVNFIMYLNHYESCFFFFLGILTLTLTNPIWVTKTRLVLQYETGPGGKQYKGMLDALVKIYRHEGVPGLYKVRHTLYLEHLCPRKRNTCFVKC